MSIHPRLKDGACGCLVDVRPRFFASHLRLRKTALRLHRREPLVPELHGQAGRVGDALGESTSLASGWPFVTAQIDGETDDESRDVLALDQEAQISDERPRIARVERASRVGHKPELVVDCEAYPSAARVEPARSTRTARRVRHGKGD